MDRRATFTSIGGMDRRVTFTSTLLLTLALGIAAQTEPDVRKPPVIQEPAAADTRFLRIQDNVNLRCIATGHPSPYYVWLRNDTEITSDSQFEVNGTTGELIIKSLSMSNEGFFKCKAVVSFTSGSPAVAVSPQVEVRVGRIEYWKRVDIFAPVMKKEGQYAVLKCDELPVIRSITNIVWQKIEGNEQRELPMDDRMFVDRKGDLHFTYVLNKDNFGNAGYYACGLNDEISRNNMVGGKRKLIVQETDGIQRIPPTKMYHTGMGVDGEKDLTFQVGQRARLECVFSGYIPDRGTVLKDYLPTIEWFDGLQQIISGQKTYNIEEEGRVLTIDNVKEEDEKDYTCRAKENGVEVTMRLNVTSPPIFKKPYLKHQAVVERNDAVFRCLARSAPGELPPEVPEWYLNGRSMSNYNHNKFKFEEGKTKMTVMSTNKLTDIACFQCVVSNSVGENSAQACLNVVLPISVFTRPAKVQTIEAGTTVDLTVQATGDPISDLNYEWVFKNKTYGKGKAPPYVVYNFTTNEAYINTTGMTDKLLRNISGLYSRIIWNNVERVNVSVEIRVKAKKVVAPVRTAEPGFPFWIIAVIIIGIIFIISGVIIVHVIFRRKQQEGDYPLVKKEIAAGLDPEKELKESEFQGVS